MPDYTKSVIYRIVCKDLSITDCYVGSTTNFKSRKACHKYTCTNPNSKDYNAKVYQFITEHGGWENWSMIMVEEFPCDNKLQLERKERETIENLKPTLNCIIPTRTDKEYRLDNKEKIKEQKKQYRETNNETINEKIGCRACKCMVLKRQFIRHTKSKKHINNLP